MKKILFLLIPLWFFFIMISCTEIGPPIQLQPEVRLLDTSYVDLNLPPADYKKVLIEEFTGVNCSNCPKGHQTMHDIEQIFGDSVIAVSIQNDNPLAKPFDAYPDWRIEEGIQISQALGGSFAIPCASVDRVKYPGQNQVVLYSRNAWKTYTDQELHRSSPCNIELSVNYDPSLRKAIVHVKIHFLSDVDSSNNLSIMVLEDNLVAPQRLPDNSVDSNYVHRHTLRDMITPAMGSTTASSTERGRVVIRDYEYRVPDDFNEDEVIIVAFVHYIGVGQRILQAASAALR